MAFDTTTPVTPRTPLMEIDLGSTTLRFSDVSLVLDDHTYYEPRIVSFPSIQLALGRTLDATLRRPSVMIVLDDADDTLRTSFDANDGWAGKPITLKVGSGTAVADYTTVLVGCRRFPGGVRWDQRRLTLGVEWDLQADMRGLPRQKFFPGTYPFAEEKASFQIIPWIYGDFRSTTLPAQRVPCYQIDHTQSVGGLFKIAEELQSIENVYKNGTATTYTVTDATAGEFTLDVSYDPLVDVIEAHVLGATTATFAGAGAEFSLPRLAYDLLTNSKLLGLAAARINVTAFAQWETDLPSNAIGRRWIGTAISSATLLSELANDGFADLYLNSANEYVPVYRKKVPGAGLTTFRQADIKPASDTERVFGVEVDPERTYANEVVGDYARKPEVSPGYGGSVTNESSAAIAAVGTRHRRRLRMNWLANAAGAEPRTSQELEVYSREIKAVLLTVGPPGLAMVPTDPFRVAYGGFELSDGTGSLFKVREIEYDFTRMEASILAYALSAFVSGFWTLDAAPNWATASDAQKAAQGFWTDASGLSDINSRWF